MKARVDALTGLRFLAAASIVLWHSQADYFFGPAAFAPFLLSGTVTLFFALSGFVLTLSTQDGTPWGVFMLRRIARIWPAHAAGLVLWGALFNDTLSFVLTPPHDAEFAWNLGLLQAWSPARLVYWSYNAPSWSLSVELFLYACFPACLWLLRRAPGAAAAACVALLAIILFGSGMVAPGLDPVWVGYINPVVNLPAFVLGIAAGLAHRHLAVPRLTQAQATALELLALAAALGMNALLSSPGDPAQPAFYYRIQSGPALAYVLLIFTLARTRGLVAAFLAHPIMVWLGEVSYALYLVHQLVFRWHALHLGMLPFGLWWQYALLLAISLGLAAFIHHAIERPVQGFVRSALRPRPALAVVAT